VESIRQAGNRLVGSLKGSQKRAQATKAGGINSLESIPGLLKSFKTPPLLFWGVAKFRQKVSSLGRAGYHFKHAEVEDKER
jgi:hypothetical protein